MEYRAFALKYRPQNFDEVIGQEYIVSSLKNAILKGRVHHAYLFSGPRGVGKTSLARIFAKALNCEKGPTITPCGKCTSCVEISRGSSLDVIEIDGASNRGIDDIRALRESINLSPAYSRYKIYIIDEVHQITTDAFNALLKTLEEPPSHVKFIFATTHPQKVLPTILSRCEKFQFHLIPAEKIMRKLSIITGKENLNIDKSILNPIAHAAGGSIRDAESLLDQIVPIALEKGEIKDIISFLGIVDEVALNTMARYIVKKDARAGMDFIQRFTEEGKDLGILVNSLIEYFRDILLCKVSPKTFKELKDVSPSSKESIAETAGFITVPDILRIMDLFIYAKDVSKKLNSVRIPLELAIVKFAMRELDNAPDSRNNPSVKNKSESTGINMPAGKNIKGASGGDSEPYYKKDPRLEKTSKPDLSHDKIEHKDTNDSKHSKEITLDDIDDLNFEDDERGDSINDSKTHLTEDKELSASSLTLQDILEKWPGIIAEMSKERVSLASCLSGAEVRSFKKGVLKLAFSKERSFNKEIIEDVKNTKYVEQYFSKYFGHSIIVNCFVEDSPQISKKDNTESVPGGSEDNDFINEILDTFGGDIKTDNE